jgi:hypothetical protein
MVLTTNSDDLVSQPVSSALQKRYALPGQNIPRLTKAPTRAQVVNITNALMMKDCPFNFVDVVPTDVEESLLNLFQYRYFMNRQLRKECVQWKTWTPDKFVEELKFAVPDTNVSRPYSSESFYELVAKLNVQFDLENDVYEINLDSSLIAIQNKFADVTAEDELKATKLLISRFPEQPNNWQAMLFREFKGEVPVIIKIEDFRFISSIAYAIWLRICVMSAGLLLALIKPDTLKRSQFANVLFQSLL